MKRKILEEQEQRTSYSFSELCLVWGCGVKKATRIIKDLNIESVTINGNTYYLASDVTCATVALKGVIKSREDIEMSVMKRVYTRLKGAQ